MSFISVLFALLLEQARPLGRGNLVHASLRAWVRWSTRNFDAGKSHHGWLAWGFSVGAPALTALLIYGFGSSAFTLPKSAMRWPMVMKTAPAKCWPPGSRSTPASCPAVRSCAM